MKWALVLFLVGACIGRSAPPAPPRRASLDLSISSMTLGNGLRVVVVRDPRATEVQVTMRYSVGSAEDPVGKPGMAHLVEHLMLQQILGSQSLFAHLESFATYFNAFTSFDSTVYVARAAPEHLEKLLAIEATRVGFRCTTITEAQFLRERDVVLDEIRQTSGLEELTFAVHRGVFEPGHPYRRAIGGSLATVGSISFADACAFADTYYTTESTALVVSGNVTPEQVQTALRKFVARIARRPAGARNPIPRAEHTDQPVIVPAPVDDAAVVFAWPLPTEPLPAVRALALVPALVGAIDGQVQGRVRAMRLGGERLPLIGIVVERAANESADDIRTAVRATVDTLLPDGLEQTMQFELGAFTFDHVQQTAIHGLYAGLEDGSDRDSHLARHAGAGRNPSEALAAEFEAVRALSSANAAALVRQTFAFARATVIELRPDERKHGRSIKMVSAPHDIGPRREMPDAAEAGRPADTVAPAAVPFVTRTLPNGMRVVLVSHSSVPIVEIRLVFGSGSADEPASRRGTAALATYGLNFDLRHLNDALKFVAAGGDQDVDVDSDHATFVVRGVDMHLDLLLAGLRRWVREGIYAEGADAVAGALRRAHKRVDADTTLSEAWYAAVYGALHPYGRSDAISFPSAQLTVSDAEQFRAAHFVPDNATLLITGHFDAVLAEKWIDYLFGDWTGTAAAMPREPAPKGRPAALAMASDSTLTRLQIALPSESGSRAQRLVAAAMLAELARDVRHQMGAAYSVDAALVERRRASRYMVVGYIDSTRAADAMKFLRDGLANLAGDREAAARAFVLARKRVLIQLRSVAGGAAALATRIERDVELARGPLTDLATAREVQALTFDRMGAVLAELDLDRAVVLARGPQQELLRVFEVIGRTPTVLSFDTVAADAAADDPLEESLAKPREHKRITVADLEDALTDDPPRQWRLALRLAAGKLWANTTKRTVSVKETCCTGYGATAFVGLRYDQQKSFGLYLSLGSLEGDYYIDLNTDQHHPVREIPIDVALAFEATAHDRLWGSVFAGLHVDRKTRPADDTDAWRGSLAVGLQVGADAVSIAGHRLGIFLHFGGTLGGPVGYGAVGVGVAYRY